MEFIKPIKFKRSFEFTFPGPPVPYTRMTRASMWTKAAQNYLGYRNALADTIRAKYTDWKLPPRPSKDEKKADKAWLKVQKQRFFALGVNVWLASDNADWDNVLKATTDAIQASGIIWNDKQVKVCLGGTREVDKENPRIEFLFGEIE